MNTLKHIAIIMDGNRRWATKRGLPKIVGHTKGADNLETIARACIENHIPFLTVYALSTENLKNRTKGEINHLMKLIEKFAKKLPEFEKHGIRINTIGDLSGLPGRTQTTLKQLEKDTSSFKSLTLTLAINYGGRNEILRAIQKIKNLKSKLIDEPEFQNYLDTCDLPEVDLMIRTGGDVRLSNFLLWQSAYAELYFTKTQWPAFKERELKKAMDYFYQAKRNRGK